MQNILPDSAEVYGDYRRAAAAISAQLSDDPDGVHDALDEAHTLGRARELQFALCGMYLLTMPSDSGTVDATRRLGELWGKRERDAQTAPATPGHPEQPPQRERMEYPDTVTVVPRNVGVVFDAGPNGSVQVQILAECPPPIGSLRLALNPGQPGTIYAALSKFVNLTDEQYDRLAALVARNNNDEEN